MYALAVERMQFRGAVRIAIVQLHHVQPGTLLLLRRLHVSLPQRIVLHLRQRSLEKNQSTCVRG